jgi:hypothetical protein
VSKPEGPVPDDVNLSLEEAAKYIAAQIGRRAMITLNSGNPRGVESMPYTGWHGSFGPLELGPQRRNKRHDVRTVRVDWEPDAPQTDRLWMGEELALVFDRRALQRVFISGWSRAIMVFEFEGGFFDIDLRWGKDSEATFLA